MRWFFAILTLILAAQAQAQTLRSTEAKLGEIIQQFSSPYIRDPQFMCYQLGRLQGFADVLAIQLTQLGGRTTANPEQQALTIAKGQELHLKADRLLHGRTYDCDAAFPKLIRGTLDRDETIFSQIKAIRKRLKGVGGEDLVVGCFHTGRLSLLSAGLSEILRQQYALGRGDKKLHELLNGAAQDVRVKSKLCKARSIH
jgi:hypothetical protein